MEPSGNQTPHGQTAGDVPSGSPTIASEDVAGCPTTPSTVHGSSGTSPSALRTALATPFPRTSRAQIEHFVHPETSDACLEIARRYLEETYQVQSKNPATLEMAQVREYPIASVEMCDGRRPRTVPSSYSLLQLLLMQELAAQEDVIHEMEQRYNELIAASQVGGLLRGWDGLVAPKKSLDTLPKDVRKFYVEATKKKDHAFSFTSATSQVYDNRPEWIQNLYGRFMGGRFRGPSGATPLTTRSSSDMFPSISNETEGASSQTGSSEDRNRTRPKAVLLSEGGSADSPTTAALDGSHNGESLQATSPSQRLQRGSSVVASTSVQAGLSAPGGGLSHGSRKSLRKSATSQHFKHAGATQDAPAIERGCETTPRGASTRITASDVSPIAPALASPAIMGTMALVSQRSAPTSASLTPRSKHQASAASLHGKGRFSEASQRAALSAQTSQEELTTEGCFSGEATGSATRAADGIRKRIAVAIAPSSATGEGTARGSGSATSSTITARHPEMNSTPAHGTTNANTPASSLRRRSRSMSQATYQQQHQTTQPLTTSSALTTPLPSSEAMFSFASPVASMSIPRGGPSERTVGPSTATGYGGVAPLADDGNSSVVSQTGSSISSTLTRSRGGDTKGDQRSSKKKKKKARL